MSVKRYVEVAEMHEMDHGDYVSATDYDSLLAAAQEAEKALRGITKASQSSDAQDWSDAIDKCETALARLREFTG